MCIGPVLPVLVVPLALMPVPCVCVCRTCLTCAGCTSSINACPVCVCVGPVLHVLCGAEWTTHRDSSRPRPPDLPTHRSAPGSCVLTNARPTWGVDALQQGLSQSPPVFLMGYCECSPSTGCDHMKYMDAKIVLVFSRNLVFMPFLTELEVLKVD